MDSSSSLPMPPDKYQKPPALDCNIKPTLLKWSQYKKNDAQWGDLYVDQYE